MNFTVEYEQEDDGRWLAEVIELPGVMVYGEDADDAVAHAQALALRVLADCLENGMSLDEIHKAYPKLQKESIQAALAYIQRKKSDETWERLMQIGQKISNGRKSEKSAVEILYEMRR